MKILVAEDEPKVANFLCQALEEAGMTVDVVATLEEVQASVSNGHYDAILLDRLLRDQDAMYSIPLLRREAPQMRIFVLSALGDVDDRVTGLTEGADDYLAKPFHVAELIARIRSMCRRTSQNPVQKKNTLIVYKDLTIDLEKQRIHRGEQRIELTRKELQILTLLARQPEKVFSKSEILNRVWDFNHHPESNIVEVTIANLRAKLDRGFPPLIQSQRGKGYWLGEP